MSELLGIQPQNDKGTFFGPADSTPQMVLPAKDVLAHVVDVHCHPTDTEVGVDDAASLSIRLCAMATRGDDQAKVADLAIKNPTKVNNMIIHGYDFGGTN